MFTVHSFSLISGQITEKLRSDCVLPVNCAHQYCMTSVPVISAVSVVLGEKAWATKADEMPTMTGRGITHLGSTDTTCTPYSLGLSNEVG